MPVRQIHRRFDKYLIERGHLPKGFEYDIVHDRIDFGVKYYCGNHREQDEYHSEAGLRRWLNGMANRGTSQEKLTAYLRAGLAHFKLDEADTRWYEKDPKGYDNLPWEKVFEGALKSYVLSGHGLKFFKKSSAI